MLGRSRRFRRFSRASSRTRPGPSGLGVAVMLLTVLAGVAPLFAGPATPTVVGLALLAGACLELAHGVRRSAAEGRRAAWIGGAITLAMSVVVLQAGDLAGRAILVLLAVWFGIDALRYAAGRGGEPGPWPRTRALPALGYGLLAVLLLLLRGSAIQWAIAAAGAFRLAGTAWSIATTPAYTPDDTGDTVAQDLDLADNPALADLARRIATEEQGRAGIDRGWIAAFAVTLFGIHLGRMGLDKSALGILSPFVAVLGDLALALIIAYGVVIPARLFTRRASRRLERRAWAWSLEAGGRRRLRAVVRGWLDHRLRFAVRLRAARYSLTAALSRGLQIGLPAAAFMAATAPVFGMSWFFDTENWAAGMWNRWAEARTDTWREAMVGRVFEHERAGRRGVRGVPGGRHGRGDFSFIVIGDTGEGDASQHVLRDQLSRSAGREDVKFIVMSSDVVYPTGAMKDYEAKFWLPFKGTAKPVYAIPGNHDWYDALEAFAATFIDRRPPGGDASARRGRQAAHEHDGRADRGADRPGRELRGSTGCPRGSSARPSSRSRPTTSR